MNGQFWYKLNHQIIIILLRKQYKYESPLSIVSLHWHTADQEFWALGVSNVLFKLYLSKKKKIFDDFMLWYKVVRNQANLNRKKR